MAASVSWSYNGSTTISVVCTGLTPSVSYALYSNDPASSYPTGVSDGSGNLSLSITDVGGLSAGDTWYAQVERSTGASRPASAMILKYGTVSTTDQGIAATWAYDGVGGGVGVLSVTFTSVIGVTYGLAGRSGSTPTVAGDGTAKTLTITDLAPGTSTPFAPVLYNTTGSPQINYAIRIFDLGTAGSGYDGVAAASDTDGRVLIALDDTPLEPNPIWTRIDNTANLVAGIDIHCGKQTLLDRTDTGTAIIYLNDTAGLFDPANVSSPYFGKLDGKQIKLQVYNPVTAAWVPQFRGHINDFSFDLDDSQVVATIQMECVDLFDYLGGYEVAPGIDGNTPPAGSEGIVFYEDTAGTIDDRIIQALTDAGIDSTMTVVFTGNVRAQETRYDPGDAILNVLRDAADAEFPGIANIYIDKLGRFIFHGRESRFDPDAVAAGATPGAWNFTRWKVGDAAAVTLDSARAQIRVLSYSRSRSDVINAAISYPRGIDETTLPSQVYIDSTSVTAYAKHSWSATDLIISEGSTTGNTGAEECFLFGKFMVLNQKDPRTRITTLTVKTLPPIGTRGSATWAVLTGADISDIVNVKVAYPGGTGINAEDYYIEGRTMRVRPLNANYDLVELDLDVSPAEWSTDTHGVFANSSARGVTAAATAAGKAGSVSIT